MTCQDLRNCLHTCIFQPAYRTMKHTAFCFILAASLAAVFPGSCAAQEDDNSTSGPKKALIEQSGIRIEFDPPAVLDITVDGLAFSRLSKFYVASPGWKGAYYRPEDDQDLLSRVKITHGADGTSTMNIPMRAPSGAYQADLSISLSVDRCITFSSVVKSTTDTKANIEHRLAGIYPGWLAGRDFSATLTSGTTLKGIVPATAESGEIEKATVVRGLSELEISTRRGPLKIDVSGSAPLSLLDYRKNKWAEGPPAFWFGILETPLRPNSTLTYSVTIQFPPPMDMEKGGTEKGAQVQSIPDLLAPYEPPDLVIPVPKDIIWRSENMELSPETPILASSQSGVKELAEELEKQIKLQTGVACKVSDAKQKSPAGISLSINPSGKWKNPEAYRLDIGKTAVVEAPTTIGLANAIKTMRQLVRIRNGKALLRGCRIDDYPTLPFRGLHMFTGHNARDLQIKMVRDILGALKVNQLVYQCDYLEWDAAPEIHNKRFGMKKDDARAVIAEAHRQHMDVIPLVNTFGHSEWLVKNSAHSDLADDPNHPYAYDPSNPEVYRICEKIYNEAIELCRPAFFNIGHDEITMRGFPAREQNRRKGVTQLIIDDILHYHKFLADRGIRTMIWGDMFIAADESDSSAQAGSVEEATRRRAMLPKDILICDWHYDSVPPEKFTSLKVFNQAGFDVVACPWYQPGNILNIATAAARQAEATTASENGKTLGVLQTTWAGYSFDQQSFDENPEQYSSYLLGAEAAWNGGAGGKNGKLPYDYTREFTRLWSAGELPNGEAAGWTTDLAPMANFSLTPGSDGSWLGYEKAGNVKPLNAGLTRLGRFIFRIAEQESTGNQGVLLTGGFNPTQGQWPQEVIIPVNRACRAISFATAATFSCPQDTRIAQTTMLFDDGTSQIIDWKVGQNVFPIDDDRGGTEAPVLWASAEKDAVKRVIHGYTWRNATTKKLKEIRTRSAGRGSALILFGVSGID